jgi:hypothetical protein
MRYITADELYLLQKYHEENGNEELVKVYGQEFEKLQNELNQD